MQETIQARGTFKTGEASRYLRQLCKHFSHKVDVTFDAHHGDVQFPFGTADLEAGQDALVATINAKTAEDLGRAQHVIDDHLKRFAFREKCDGMSWEVV
ncbi:DUF2218 domain-containing protein [Palleronia abyssalis]|uniref:2,4-dihydroxyhept-2-ene-1,7-dioic acid aldolase n=1 Tax=Palleronia abyssalis TaxID=1501240 RepID=A0A2R8BYW2_9RHOB|nr:DUF2218 domain-containing protein [Palleronia abyssalis]SPJ25303.1 hypothetical protein PAA8504_03154 [Palleronia abyssalis]